MKLLLPIILGLVGAGTGIGAAAMLGAGKESADPGCVPAVDDEALPDAFDPPEQEEEEEGDYVDFPRQFLIPVVEAQEVAALVILSLGLEIRPGAEEAVFAKEPKLRDLFLEQLFLHASLGKFETGFTMDNSLSELKRDLTRIGSENTDGRIKSVLITEIARQEK